MQQNKYIKNLHQITSIDELNSFKENFLSECSKREKKILVSNIINEIQNFCVAKHIFESIAPHLLNKKEGKSIINNYINTIKENKSIKTLYVYNEGLSKYSNPEEKKAYITEALSLTNLIDKNEYQNGISNIIKIIVESFKLLDTQLVLENVSINKESNIIGDSLYYLSTTEKNISNLNEYIHNINVVSNIIKENIETPIDIDITLEEIIENNKKIDTNDIFESENKEDVFNNAKYTCLEMIQKQKKSINDDKIIENLNEIECKLSKKSYSFDTFTKDMFYLKELSEVLK